MKTVAREMVRAAMQMNIKSLLSMRMDVLYCIIIIIIIIITIWYHTYQGTIGTTGGTHRYFNNTFFSEILPIHWRI